MLVPAAVRVKLRALRALNEDEAITAFARRLLEDQTSPSVLQAAAEIDGADRLKLLDKAVTERKKNASETEPPTLDDLNWSYAEALSAAGRVQEALRLAAGVIDRTRASIAALEGLPEPDPRRSRLVTLRDDLVPRAESFQRMWAAAGDYDRALLSISMAQENATDDPGASTAKYEVQRAEIYAKTGKPDLELESWAKAFAARMDARTRDRIRERAPKVGKTAEEVFARAREIRTRNAVAIGRFTLKTLDGRRIALGSARSKVLLVNFFFPT